MNIFKEYARKNLDRAKLALLARDAAEAHRFAHRAARLDQGLEEAWLILAATSVGEESIKFAKKALAINPESEKAKRGLAWATSERKNDGNSGEKPAEIHARLAASPPSSLPVPAAFGESVQEKKKNGRSFFNIITNRWQSIFALILVGLILGISAFAPLISPVDDPEGEPYFKLACDKIRCNPEPPSNDYILGTVKEFDVFHTVIWGTRQSLIFGISTAFITALIGTLLGAAAGYTGGWIDRLIMRICDAFLAFPIAAAVALFAQIVTLLSPVSNAYLTPEQFNAIPKEPSFFQRLVIHTDPILLALVLLSWMPYARIIHAQVLRVKQTEYVEAAKAVGARHRRIIWNHILPNSISPAIVMGTRDIGRMVVIQASLTFIGIGSSSAWAILLNTGKDWIIGPGGNLLTRWWIYLPVTLAVVVFGVSWSLLGDEINHWMNPKNI
jgi:peptide/nickel transport system permease protein